MDTITSLQITDTKAGSGAEATAGTHVTVHYTGWLFNPNAATLVFDVKLLAVK